MVGMKVKDYGSTDATLRRQHLDKWHTFSKITDTSRATQGWRQGKVSLSNAAYALPTSIFNNAASSTSQLTLTKTAAWAIGANAFPNIFAGDVLTVVVTGVSAPAVTGTLTLTVARVVSDSDVSTKGYLEFVQTVGDVAATLLGVAVTITAATASVARPTSAEATSTVSVASATIDTVTIKAHGIPIYNSFVDTFYNAYLPYHFGGPNVNVPKDTGALFIPFCLYPSSYQPSGHINVSRAREFYFEYSSSVIDTNTPGTLVVAASAINFLLISDGSAKLLWHSDKSNFIASTIVLCNTPFIRESLAVC